ncbi:hypothetical protein QMK19_01120 [Streptomyces sp. H10-C2]|uniref:hypothetical protein n=1 Tax=unclassified Streptomyces TaxID=2593676 RepID=UPI0024BB3A81|nr:MULTISPECIES: hypothetical protein [unclassified Streptomyces]MDJ0340233.1 hypothetical protein [Streptomyces sp. PH10-H1]MDJ0368318.1 hypothetical protein [Streptomyces sp. H10-C2]
MMRRLAATVAVAGAALAGLQGTALADPAVPVWQPQGTAVTGAATTAEAQALTAGTTYKDTLKVGDTKYYGVDLDAKSAAYLSAFAIPKPGAKVAYGDGIDLKLQSADGTDCDSFNAHFDSDGAARPVGGYAARTIEKGGQCQEANRYTLEIKRSSAGTSDPGDWPVEIRFLSEPGLKADAKPVPASSATEASPTPVTGTPRPAVGGTSFDTAAAIKSGIWNDKVLPGETRFYKVPVDWGQHAVLFADFANAPKVKDNGFQSAGVRVAAYNPARGHVSDATESYAGKQTSITGQTVAVSFANRYESGSAVSATRFAGWYYFAVSVHPGVKNVVDGPIGVTLRLDVKGAAGSAPGYDGDAAKAGFGVNGDDLAKADGTATGGGSNATLRFVAFAALGAGTVLLLSLAVWMVAARRRPHTADGAPRPPQSPESGYGPPPAW